MLYLVLGVKSYARNLQYRGAHMVHNIASALFGYMYACIWIGIGSNHTLGDYGVQGMVSYIAFTQSSLWISGFNTVGLGIPQSVRTGHIVLDLMRPVHLYTHMMSREWGQIAYQFLYKSVPIYTLYFFIFSIRTPATVTAVLLIFLSLILSAYISISINYIIGASALWTTESNWLYWGNHAFVMLLAGFFIPIEWLPEWLQTISWMTPYPYLLYVPTRIYLGFESGSILVGSFLWCLFMTGLCLVATRLLRRKVEVQGG